MTKKTLSERIAIRAGKKLSNTKARNRAAFLANRGEIKRALDDGWPVKAIWETLKEEGKIAFSYQAFIGYVNRLILDKAAEQEKNSTERDAKRSKPGSLKGFKFDAAPKKEELL